MVRRMNGRAVWVSVVLALCLSVAGVVWVSGWGRDARSERLNCAFERGTLVLGYTYGRNEVVSMRLDVRDDRVVVSATREGSDDGSMSPLFRAEARYSSVEPGVPVTYPDGRRLDCPVN
jgi:hypothetical protein